MPLYDYCCPQGHVFERMATIAARAQQADGKLPPDEYLVKTIPAGRLGIGEDVAAMCSFLCSEAAGYVTGQVIGVNGGAVI